MVVPTPFISEELAFLCEQTGEEEATLLVRAVQSWVVPSLPRNGRTRLCSQDAIVRGGSSCPR